MAELKWLEDLVALMEEDSFTKAAQRRFVTQPAFSRRIRLLEEWLGVELVDRKRKPVSILPQAREHETQLKELVGHFYKLRNNLQNRSRQQRTGFVVQHTLAISHFPKLIREIQPTLPNKAYHLQTANNEECVRLFDADMSFLLCYQLPEQALIATSDELHCDKLGVDRLIPVAQQALFDEELKYELESSGPREPLPLLMFPKGGFLAEVLSGHCLPNAMRDYGLDLICESAFAISLKEMVLAGMGVAWLPEGLIAKELENHALVSLEHWLDCCDLDICLYRRL